MSKGLRDNIIFVSVGAVVAICLYLVFMYVPDERVMGAVQRIFYFHVASAIACYCAFAVVLIAGITFLTTGSKKADDLMIAGSELSLLLATIVMASGMIWGKAAWNTWFVWEPRLVSFLVLWMVALALNLVRVFGDQSRSATHAAIIGIVGAVMVPVVVFSVKLLPAVQQLHPQVVGNRGLKDSRYYTAFGLTVLGMILLQFTLIWVRARVSRLERLLSSRN